MKLENQVCSLEQAKRLKELGVVQKSLFYHEFVKASSGTGGWSGWNINYRGKTVYDKWSAFTVAELGVMLPLYCDTVCTHTHWDCVYNTRPTGIIHQELCHPTEAQARAAMLIHLLENNHITPFEVNQRLSND